MPIPSFYCSFGILVWIQLAGGHILRLPCLKYANFSTVVNDSVLQGHVLETISIGSIMECQGFCLEHSQCKSINVKLTDDMICQLNSKSDLLDNVILTTSSGWIYQTSDYSAKNVSI